VRVTSVTSFREGAAFISAAATALAEAQRQVSSGRRVDRPSTDPSAAAAAIGDRATLGSLAAFTKAADAATSRLTVVDSILSDVVDKITDAQTKSLGARGSTQTQVQRDTAAADLQGIADALLLDFNTQFRGAYLFGGASATTAPFTKTGTTVSPYQGDSIAVSVDVDAGRAVQVSVDGGAVAKGSDTADIFATLSTLIAAVRAGDNNGIGQGIDALGRAMNRATQAQTTVGVSLQSLDEQRSRLSVVNLDTKARLSRDQDANMAEAITAMNQAETSYRAALGAFATNGKLSLLDYLR
jgi:flagellar hook-associated protein 3 FlgL